MIIKTGIIPRVAFSIFGIDIYWYAILICLGIIIGYIWSWKNDGKYGIKFSDVLDLSIFMIPIAIICARIYYIIFNLDYYIKMPSEIFNFRNGGIAIYGALIGGIVTILIFCQKRKINILNLLDFLAPIIPLAQAIGRWGNYINIEAYRAETNSILKMEIIENGIAKYVHPTFLYESVGNIIVFILLVILSKNKKFKGEIAVMYFLGYSIVRFFVEGLRTDSLMLGSIRISQLLSLIIFIVCVFILAYKKIYKKSVKNKSAKNV